MSQDVFIKVEFYSEEEEKLIKENYPFEYPILKVLTIKGVEVPYEDFLTYCIFNNQNSEIPGYRTYAELNQRIKNLAGPFIEYTLLETSNSKLKSKFNHNNEQTHVSESIGNAGALSVLSYAYGLTQADWKRINIAGHKDFDFDSTIIDGFSKKLVVEAKGTIVEDNMSTALDSRIRSQKRSIKLKKKDKSLKIKYKTGVNLLLGAIAVLDPINHLKVLLVDPPSNSEMTPNEGRKIKLIKRLKYYQEFIDIIIGKTNLALVLFNRIKSLEKITVVSELDNLSLKTVNGKQIILSQSYIMSHSNISQSILGQLKPIGKDRAMFIGVPVNLIDILVEQNQNKILDFKMKPDSAKQHIEIFFPYQKASQLPFFQNSTVLTGNNSNILKFKLLNINVITSTSGLTHAIITKKDLEKARLYE
tara:strand:- start:326 stop:1579 length:1254 start_codon:yes stop_codon:yes gene_type:complete